MGDNSLSQTVIVVENAGHPEANGTYRFEKMYRGAGYFSRDGVFKNKEVSFVISKEEINGIPIWYLSTWFPRDERSKWHVPNRLYVLPSSSGNILPSMEKQWTNYQDGKASPIKVISVDIEPMESRQSPMVSLYRLGEFSDFTVIYLGEEFPVHKCILGTTSFYFKRLFSGNGKKRIPAN
jgi:hypothetical protein